MRVQSQLPQASDLYIVHLKQQTPNEMILEPPFENAWLDTNISTIKRRSYRKKRFFIPICLVTIIFFAVTVIPVSVWRSRFASTTTITNSSISGMLFLCVFLAQSYRWFMP
ncbi:unnamed protein product [Rotaria sp. Silwood2]|nr:unnamed protein product [Rotaria sp. Silwood2]